MDKASRSVAAALIAPVTPSVLTVFVPVLASWSWSFGNELPIILSASLLISYVALFTFGIPAIVWLRRRGALNGFNLILVGAAAGAVFGALAIVGLGLTLGTLKYEPLWGLLYASAWGAGYGVASAIVYGVIAGWPNNSSKPTPLRGSA